MSLEDKGAVGAFLPSLLSLVGRDSSRPIGEVWGAGAPQERFSCEPHEVYLLDRPFLSARTLTDRVMVDFALLLEPVQTPYIQQLPMADFYF